MLEWLSSRGYTVRMRVDWVAVFADRAMTDVLGNWKTVPEAYFALGGPRWNTQYNPKGLKP